MIMQITRLVADRMNSFLFSYGVFQTYYSTHEPFSYQPAGIAAISTTTIAFMFFASPFVALIIQRYPGIRLPGGIIGLAIMEAALICASFSSSTSALLGTQGILYADSGLVVYFPAMYLVDEWFVARKGMAIGVIWSATGFAGAIIPFLLHGKSGMIGNSFTSPRISF